MARTSKTVITPRRQAKLDLAKAEQFLEEVAGQSAAIRARARQLGLLLAKKNVVEYEARLATQKEVTEAIGRASRIVGWARETVQQARL